MSSNIRINRVCQHCNKLFIAKTTVTKYCSDNCAKRAYKIRLRESKLEASNNETLAINLKPLDEIQRKEFLTVRDVATLLNCSKQTIYSLIQRKTIIAINLSQRKTLIKRESIDALFSNSTQSESEPVVDLNSAYSLVEVQQKYSISEKALFELIRRNSIPKLKHGIYTYVPMTKIDKLFNPDLKVDNA